MAASSNHYADVGNWVERVIDSCETPMQERTARKLFRLFEKRIEKEAPDLYLHYSRRLSDKINEIMYNRIEKRLKENGNAN